jgi:protein-S-isoprenylcysteine O-methyltransferase Ste14
MVFRHIIPVLLLPGTVTCVVPYLILSIQPAWSALCAAWDPLCITRVLAGVASFGAGLLLMFLTVRQFATRGRGTLAPWDPPRHLVTTGAYGYTRNPMISGVLLVLLGETLVFRSVGLLVWLIVFIAVNAIYIPLVEEPSLERRFGREYLRYRGRVRRWFPRLTGNRKGRQVGRGKVPRPAHQPVEEEHRQDGGTSSLM